MDAAISPLQEVSIIDHSQLSPSQGMALNCRKLPCPGSPLSSRDSQLIPAWTRFQVQSLCLNLWEFPRVICISGLLTDQVRSQLQPHGNLTSLYPVLSSLLSLYVSPKVGEVAQSCPIICDPMDCSLPGSSIRGIFQARVLEWVAISSYEGHTNEGLEYPLGKEGFRDYIPSSNFLRGEGIFVLI